jgi:DNA mismatch repair ATPase MutL
MKGLHLTALGKIVSARGAGVSVEQLYSEIPARLKARFELPAQFCEMIGPECEA